MDLYVEKDTDLMRSTLIAIGLGNLFERLPSSGSGFDIRIRDLGSTYVINVPYEIDDALSYLKKRLGRLPALIPAIRKAYSAGDQKTIEADPESKIQFKYVPRDFDRVYGTDAIVEYGMQQELARTQRASKKEARVEGQVTALHPNYSLWAHLCSYFGKGSAMRNVYPNILHAWYSHQGDDAEALLKLIVEAYAEFPNTLGQARTNWVKWGRKISYQDYEIETDVTAASIISPSTVQGASTKSSASTINNNPLNGFWLEIYLAFAGYFVAGLPFNLGDDVMLFYPRPQNITISSLRQQMHTYRDSEIGRSLYRFSNQMNRAKLDILATISFYQSRVHQIHDNLTGWDDMIQDMGGLVGYYYKNNGGTQIPFDETLFGTPPFFPKHTDAEQAQHIGELLERHYQIIDAIRGKPPKYALTADELSILEAYRHFMIHARVEDWWRFAVAYNRYRFINMGSIYLPDFHLEIFKETLMNMQPDRKDFRKIIDDEGFLHIANAIRHCTVTLRYLLDVKKQTSAFRVRHGLGDDLLRNAHDPNQFIAELGRFLHDYSRESSRVQAETGDTRPFVTEEDIQHLIALIAEYGSSTVAHLLVAVGYSSAYRRDNN